MRQRVQVFIDEDSVCEVNAILVKLKYSSEWLHLIVEDDINPKKHWEHIFPRERVAQIRISERA